MSDNLRGSAAIVGVGHSGFGVATGRNAMEIQADACNAALKEAGLTTKDIDCVMSASAFHYMPSMSLAAYLGIKPKFSEGTVFGGSSFVHYLLNAMMAIEAGLCETVLIAYGSNQRSIGRGLTSMSEPALYEAPFKPLYPISSYALAAARHMHQYGTTREHLAEVAVAARGWAKLNPEAFERGDLSIEDVLASRVISDPLSVRDCCLVTDGGGALVVVKADRAKDFPKPPAYIMGVAGAHWHRNISDMPDLTVTAASESGPRAFEMAGVTPADIDVAEVYDAFTINTILFLEDLGFCKKGEGGDFVSGGNIAPGGGLAVNTNGGGLSCVHPGMYGIFTIIEAVRQLRGECGERQIEGAKLAVAHGNGGVLSSQVTSVLGNENAL